MGTTWKVKLEDEHGAYWLRVTSNRRWWHDTEDAATDFAKQFEAELEASEARKRLTKFGKHSQVKVIRFEEVGSAHPAPKRK
jgi:uncharacterized protein YeaO (DUF488 family)